MDRGALHADTVTKVCWSREPAFALPLALDVHGLCPAGILQVDANNPALGVTRGSALMLVVERIAHFKGRLQVGDAVGGQQSGNFVRSKPRMIAHTTPRNIKRRVGTAHQFMDCFGGRYPPY